MTKQEAIHAIESNMPTSGYYVDEELACEEIRSNIDGSIGIQGDAISKLAILENMIEDGNLVAVGTVQGL